MLEIKNLKVTVNNNLILNNINLTVNKNEIHVIMGKNGSGKSTLAKILVGHPLYKIINGNIIFENIEISNFKPEKRAEIGIFLGFQNPIEISGVNNEEFLRTSFNLKQKKKGLIPLNVKNFSNLLNTKFEKLKLNSNFKTRNINQNFSGGEKKKNEILQMLLLDPKLIILDEIDSGLDIDAMKEVINNIKEFYDAKKSIIFITHYPQLFEYLKPSYVHIMDKGKLIMTGGFELTNKIKKEGYNKILKSKNEK